VIPAFSPAGFARDCGPHPDPLPQAGEGGRQRAVARSRAGRAIARSGRPDDKLRGRGRAKPAWCSNLNFPGQIFVA